MLSKQANKALFSLMKQLPNLSYPKPSLMCYLFDSFKPVMNYGAEAVADLGGVPRVPWNPPFGFSDDIYIYI